MLETERPPDKRDGITFSPARAADVTAALWLTYVTIGWMTIEGAASLLLGWASKSLLLEAFGIDSVVELFSAGVLLWRLKVEANGLADETRVEAVERRAARWVGCSLYALVAYVIFNSAYGLFVVERVTDTHESVWGILIGLVAKGGYADSRRLQAAGGGAFEFAGLAGGRDGSNHLRLSLHCFDGGTRSDAALWLVVARQHRRPCLDPFSNQGRPRRDSRGMLLVSAKS